MRAARKRLMRTRSQGSVGTSKSTLMICLPGGDSSESGKGSADADDANDGRASK